MITLGRKFLIGLTILLPVAISVQLIIWLVRTLEAWFRPIWTFILPENWYLPGFGIVSFLLVVFLIGFSSHLPILNLLWKLPGRIIESTPVARTIYGIVKDLLDLFSGKNFDEQSVVWITVPATGARMLGIVTMSGKDKNSVASQFIEDDEVTVYLPMSYQSGGYMMVLPRSRLEPVDMDPGDALRLIMSAGLGQRSVGPT